MKIICYLTRLQNENSSLKPQTDYSLLAGKMLTVHQYSMQPNFKYKTIALIPAE